MIADLCDFCITYAVSRWNSATIVVVLLLEYVFVGFIFGWIQDLEERGRCAEAMPAGEEPAAALLINQQPFQRRPRGILRVRGFVRGLIL